MNITETLSPDEAEPNADDFSQMLSTTPCPKSDTSLKSLILESLMETAIPGNRIIGAKSRSLTHKVSWLVVLSITILLNGLAIFYVFDEWNETLIVTETRQSKTPVWKIPFPAITICPETKADKSMLNITQLYHEFNETDYFSQQPKDKQLKIAAIAQVCDPFVFGAQNFSNHIFGSDCVGALKEMAVTKEEMFFYCKFRSDPGICDTFFHEVLTDDGVCFTFNILSASDIFKDSIHDEYPTISHEEETLHWQSDTGYSISNLLDVYPTRALAGSGNGLFVLLRLYEQNFDYICKGPLQGFKVAVHAPGSVPSMEKHYFRVPLDQEVIATISPSVISYSEELRSMSPNDRQCYFKDERFLMYFKEYSQANCELECLTNFTMEHCGCVKFNMPRVNGANICGGDEITCMMNASKHHQLSEASKELDSSINGQIGVSSCNCLPSCSHIEYDISTSQSFFDWKSLFNAFQNPIDEFQPMQLSRLSIILKDNYVRTTQHTKSNGKWTLIALCGGMVAICTGISLLSIFETIFCIFTKLCEMKRSPRQKFPMSPIGCDRYTNI